MAKALIIGYGEIGNAIAELERKAGNQACPIDQAKGLESVSKWGYDRMHVCIPYSDQFVAIVQSYIVEYESKLVIVHSTVPVGITQQLANHVPIVHSPCMGKHPNLYKSLLTFTKFLGGPESSCKAAKEVFDSLKVETQRLGDYEATELAKLLDTSYYGWNIAFAAEVSRLCKEHKVDYDKVYTTWNKAYNEGYSKMAMRHVVRPILRPPEDGKIGGHCVISNSKLLDKGYIKDILTLFA